MACPYERRHCPGDGRDYRGYQPAERIRLCAECLLTAFGLIPPIQEGIILQGETFTHRLVDIEGESVIAVRSPPSHFVTVDRSELWESTEVVRCQDCGATTPSLQLCTRGGHPANGDVDGIILCTDCREARR
jgi:hypothetical protein